MKFAGTYALEEAQQQTVPLPLVTATRELFQQALSQGHADKDFIAVAEALRPRS